LRRWGIDVYLIGGCGDLIEQAWAERDLTALDIKEYYQERRLKELQLGGPLTDEEMNSASMGRSARDLDW
jgi:hypothetical protein